MTIRVPAWEASPEMDDNLVSTLDVGGEPVELISLPRPRLLALAKEGLPYAGAAASYILIGVFVNEFMLSWIAGFAWLLLWVWVLPGCVRRLWR